MKKNVGTADKIIRVILAVVLAVLYLTGVVKGTLGVLLLILAVILVATSFASLCPIYALLGLSSNKKKQ